MHRFLALLLAAWLTSGALASAHAQEDAEAESDFDPARARDLARRGLVANLHILDMRVAVGGNIDIGRAGIAPRGGLHVAAGFDLITNEVLGAKIRALSFDFVWNQHAGGPALSADQVLIAPTLVRVDHLFFGAHDGGVCVAPFLTVWPASHCDPGSGYVGIGGSLIGYQHDTETSRNTLRVGELYAALSFLPAFDEAFFDRRLPFLVGVSLDYVWNLSFDPRARSELWIGRALFAVDASFRFAEARGAVEARFSYRPSFTEWGDDFGIEASLRVLYADFHDAFRPQGSLFRLVVEMGYAHWSIPQRGLGLSNGGSLFGWAGVGTDSIFLRVGLEPVIWHVP